MTIAAAVVRFTIQFSFFLIQVCSEKLKSGVMQKFAHLMEALKEFQRKAVEKIEGKQAAVLGQVQENWNQLQHQLATCTQFNKEAGELLDSTDDMKFLEVSVNMWWLSRQAFGSKLGSLAPDLSES